MNEKRNSDEENAQLGLFDAGTVLDRQGSCPVGARQGEEAVSPWGGGYPETCTVLKFSARPPETEKNRDPRLEELQRIGLKRVWLDVAEEIGVDAFLATWRILDADDSSRHKEGFLQIHLKLYRSFLRYQRNRYIEALTAQGYKPLDIQRCLMRQLREPVSLRHISRLACGD